MLILRMTVHFLLIFHKKLIVVLQYDCVKKETSGLPFLLLFKLGFEDFEKIFQKQEILNVVLRVVLVVLRQHKQELYKISVVIKLTRISVSQAVIKMNSIHGVEIIKIEEKVQKTLFRLIKIVLHVFVLLTDPQQTGLNYVLLNFSQAILLFVDHQILETVNNYSVEKIVVWEKIEDFEEF